MIGSAGHDAADIEEGDDRLSGAGKLLSLSLLLTGVLLQSEVAGPDAQGIGVIMIAAGLLLTLATVLYSRISAGGR